MKIREITSNDLDLNKSYSGHDPEQHSREFSHWTTWIMLIPMVLLRTVLITRKILNENELIIIECVFLSLTTFVRNIFF